MDIRDQKTVRCRECGYLLHALEGRRCPECGTVFDPGRGDTVHGLGPGTVSGKLVLLVMLLTLLAAVGVLLITLRS